MDKLIHIPAAASAHAAELDHLADLVHYLMFALAIGWSLYFIYVLFRFRASKNPKADYGGAKSHLSTYLEIGVVFIEMILLLGFSIPFWTQKVAALPSEDESVVVRAVAEQFAWNLHYPGPDKKFGRVNIDLMDPQSNPLGIDRTDPQAKDDFYTVNDLAIPVNRKVIVKITSKDVIHSFFLPVMRVKHDAIPGVEIPVWFEPIMTGDWEIACAQLCGLGHYSMKGNLRVLSQADYDTWHAERVKEVLSQGAGSGDQSGDSFWQ